MKQYRLKSKISVGKELCNIDETALMLHVENHKNSPLSCKEH